MQKGYGIADKAIMIGIDGMDPLYTKQLLAEGKLPHIAEFVKRGTTTKDMGMMGVLPAYTPPSWCTLATGAWPGTHGITDFWTHTAGDELSKLRLGFNSELCKVEYAWDKAAEQGKNVLVYGWPTSWPPRSTENLTMVDGSGVHPLLASKVDYEKIIDCKEGDFPLQFIDHDNNDSGAECFVTEEVDDLEFKPRMPSESNNLIDDKGGEDDNIGGKFDQVISPIKPATGWADAPADAKEVTILINTGRTRRQLLILKNADGVYDRVQLYKDKKSMTLLGEATVGGWMENVIDHFTIGSKEQKVSYHIKVVSLAEDGSEIKLYYNFATSWDICNRMSPASLQQELFEKFGTPMMLSNLSHEDPLHCEIMADVGEIAFKWSMDTIDYLMDTREWDIVFHGLHIIDFANHLYLDNTLPDNPNAALNKECLNRFYDIADEYVGRALKWLDQGVPVIVVSDHGGLIKYPGYETPEIGDAWGLNVGLMRELGYTKTKTVNGQLEIDWEHTTAIAQRSSYIYLNLKGRDPHGIVEPEEADELITKIISDLYAYRDHEHGERVFSIAMRRSEMAVLGLNDASAENLGDIFFILEPKFTRDQGNSFSNCEILGTSLKCLFMMAGPGIKENYIIPRDVQEVDVTPTLCHLAAIDMPNGVEGGVLYQALKD